jgi:hypothetical protein
MKQTGDKVLGPGVLHSVTIVEVSERWLVSPLGN